MSVEVLTLDRMDRIGGHPVTVLGAPRLARGPHGPAVEFDGGADGLQLPVNPLAGLSSFTVEALFRPDPGGLPEQRFLHLGTAHGDRTLLETRLTADGHWFLDTYIHSAAAEGTLLNQGFLHPLGRWYHLALAFDGTDQANYVDGRLERRSALPYVPAGGGQTSIGVRLNQVCWFRGAIGTIRITPRALGPEHFLLLAGS
jgi:hypothetical protein